MLHIKQIKSNNAHHMAPIIEIPDDKTKYVSMDHVKRVNNLNVEGNIAENWRRFKINYDIFEEAAGLSNKDESIRVASFLNAIRDEEAVDLFHTFGLSDQERKQYKKVRAAFESFCTQKKRVLYERFVFFSRNQMENEPFDSFLVDIKKLSKTCEFGDQAESLISDRIVLGSNNNRLQARLLERDELKFKDAMEICKAAEIS